MKKQYCRMFIVRHGQTQWNFIGRIQGHTDSRLTKAGIQEAESLAKRLKRKKFAGAFSSDVARAKRTAEIIALEHKMVVTASKLLRERSFGKYEGSLIKDFRETLRGQFKRMEKLSKEERFAFKLDEDVESDGEVVARLIVYLREIALAYLGKQILVVCHGGAMRSLLIHLGFAEYDELPAFSIDNLGYCVLESDGVDFFVKETYGVHKTLPQRQAGGKRK